MTYKVTRAKGHPIPKVLKDFFSSYEEARSAVRKWLRSKKNTQGMYKYNNPSINAWNFSIKKINGTSEA